MSLMFRKNKVRGKEFGADFVQNSGEEVGPCIVEMNHISGGKVGIRMVQNFEKFFVTNNIIYGNDFGLDMPDHNEASLSHNIVSSTGTAVSAYWSPWSGTWGVGAFSNNLLFNPAGSSGSAFSEGIEVLSLENNVAVGFRGCAKTTSRFRCPSMSLIAEPLGEARVLSLLPLPTRACSPRR